MDHSLQHLLRGLAIASILVAGSCAVPHNSPDTISEDGAVNHPIAVEPSYRELKVTYAGGADGMSADDAAKLDAFLADYRTHGNGSLSISAPGSAGRAAITFFAEHAAATGISRNRILVSTRESGGDGRVSISYIAYTARADSCGDWSENLAYSADNLTPGNFGCSVQHNIAAMVADPRDLLGPRPFEPADANRAGAVLEKYEQGMPTAAQKTGDQSGTISDVK